MSATTSTGRQRQDVLYILLNGKKLLYISSNKNGYIQRATDIQFTKIQKKIEEEIRNQYIIAEITNPSEEFSNLYCLS